MAALDHAITRAGELDALLSFVYTWRPTKLLSFVGTFDDPARYVRTHERLATAAFHRHIARVPAGIELRPSLIQGRFDREIERALRAERYYEVVFGRRPRSPVLRRLRRAAPETRVVSVT